MYQFDKIETNLNFYDQLDRLGVQDILNHQGYQSPDFCNWFRVNQFLLDLVTNGNTKSALVYGDYDVDGLMCAKIMEDALKHLGVKKVDVYHYTQRTHALDTLAVQQAILGQYDYFIVCDTGSSSMELLNRVARHGIRIVVLDHHVSNYSYEEFNDNTAIINTKLENMFTQTQTIELSAGALCYVVIRKFCEENGFDLYKPLAAYATVSLYSDCMNMANSFNRAIYYESKAIPRENLPHLIKLFLNDYSVFGARYIGFWFAPRINALFRSESFDVLNQLCFDALDYNNEVVICEIIEDLYGKIRELTKELADIIEVTELDHFVVGDLQSVEEYYNIEKYKIYNYTGLVANMLSEKYGKACVVYCFAGSEIKGSVRDLFSRDYLSLFQHICNAGGHPPAFGFHIGAFDLDTFLNSLRYLDANFSIDDIHNEPIILPMTAIVPDELLINDIATYNEFSGQGLPVVYIKKQLVGIKKEIKTPYNFKYKWGNLFIQSDYSIPFGSYVLLKPIQTMTTKLLVK